MKKCFILCLCALCNANPYFEHKAQAEAFHNQKMREAGDMIDLFWNPQRDAETLKRNEAAKPKTAEECAIYAFKTEWCTAKYPKERQLYYDKIACQVVAPGCIVAGDKLSCETYKKHDCVRFIKEPK